MWLILTTRIKSCMWRMLEIQDACQLVMDKFSRFLRTMNLQIQSNLLGLKPPEKLFMEVELKEISISQELSETLSTKTNG